MGDSCSTGWRTIPFRPKWRSPMPTLSGEDFGKFVTAEVERWGKVVKEAQVKLE